MFNAQNLMYVNCGGNQSAERDQEVGTAETTAIIYATVHFVGGRWGVLPS